MDSGSLVVSGRLDGQRGEYDVPIILALYGSNDPVVREDLKNRMARDRLPLDAINSRDKEAKKKRAAELKMASKQASMVGWSQLDLPGHPGSSGAPAPTMEDIIAGSQYFNPREIGEVVEKYGVGEDELSKLPMMDAPKRLNTELLPYQRQGLAWLVDRESPKLPVAGSSDIVQLWKRSLADSSVFTNIATNFSVKNELPKLASGGVLADDMGLGKTLQIIALILADQDRGAQTLIICPVSVMSNWSGQVGAMSFPSVPFVDAAVDCSSRQPKEASSRSDLSWELEEIP
jgi:SWI/SNF-related matrix-associated actin-dependent regulator of chromatin subfamily A3